MKTTRLTFCKATVVAILIAAYGNGLASPDMAGPRALEENPRLARQASGTREFADRVPAGIENNKALVSNPRTLEEYPQLARAGYPVSFDGASSELARVLRNKALANSPREREIFPCLTLAPHYDGAGQATIAIAQNPSR